MMESLRKALGKHSDVVLVAMVLGVLAVLFAPIPKAVLDVLLLANLCFALLLLMLTFYMQRPVEFSTFPSLLLLATLFRLALNVAATRLILTDGHAGQVINAVGAYVVSGNYVIGLIVFLILVVVQYVVVTNGAQRVSEVAARFTLDSMPGQQMSIDADLNMGFIDQAEAQKRRKSIEKQAAFYGAMDGASKFVKGDAIAGILILLINIVGGLIIGVMQRGMGWADAMQTYTLLTIGDGIVTQIPALVIALGTGIIVTRSASDAQLNIEALGQLLAHPKPLALVAVALLMVGLVPGIPMVTVLVLSALLLLAAWMSLVRRRRAGESGAEPEAESKSADEATSQPITSLELRLGASLAPLWKDPSSVLLARSQALRVNFESEFGFHAPELSIRVDDTLPAKAYRIDIFGVSYGRGEIEIDRVLAIHPTGDTKHLTGIETREPTYGLPAIWIEASQRERARAARFTLVEPVTMVLTHLGETIKQQAANLLTRAETDRLIQLTRQRQPGLVEDIMPTVLGLADIQRVLQGLLKEKVSLRNFDAILETLADVGRANKDAATLTEAVRQRLGGMICQQLMGDATTLQVMTLDPLLEQRLRETVSPGPDRPAADPRFIEAAIARTVGLAEQMVRQNLLPILLCAPDLRRHVRQLTERALPHMRVISVSEIPNIIPLKSFGSVTLPAADTH